MVGMALDRNHGVQDDATPTNEEALIKEEIEGIIKLYKNGYVERSFKVMSCVSPFLAQNLQVNARDVFIDTVNNIWARIYVPKCNNNNQDYNNYHNNKFPLVIYFHGGGFCVGSTAWKCYHNFLGYLSSEAQCIIVSVNYRLAPENRLPAAYEDGMSTLTWVKQQAIKGQNSEFWVKYCDFSNVFLSGDNAGANLAYNVSLKIGAFDVTPLKIKGIILIHPFIGGEERTSSELINLQSQNNSTRNLAAFDAYWRLALPLGADRDHPWCNPLGKDKIKLENKRVMICVAEKDILRDRNLELCSSLAKNVGNEVECLISNDVKHGFYILDESQLAQNRKREMVYRIVEFISN